MESLNINLIQALLFIFILNLLFGKEKEMLCMRVKKNAELLLVAITISLVLFATPALADTAAANANNTGLFGELIAKGSEIFNGIREIVFVVSGFGIIGVAVGGFFGNLNWKWLSAIIIGLMVIGLTGSIIQFVAGDTANVNITNTLI